MGRDLRLRIKELYERNPLSSKIVRAIADLMGALRSRGVSSIKIMNFCGTHEWTITYYGVRSLMPEGASLIAGPGCPVCITPGYYVEELAKLSFEGYHVLTYGDAFRLPALPGSKREFRSLAAAKLYGGKVGVVYSFLDALRIARSNPSATYVFFAVGFETTVPSTAEPLFSGAVPENLLVLTAYRLTPPIMRYLLSEVEGVELGGVIAPGHVSAITGYRVWEFLPKEFGVPTVVAGFEPLDVLLAVMIILNQAVRGTAELVNEYGRVVRPEGSLHAKRVLMEVHEVVDAYWRGVGLVRGSGLALKDAYGRNDAFRELGIREGGYFSDVLPGCRCGEVVLGKAVPTDCPLFMKACTPDTPYGPCMVSSEGTCRIWAENRYLLGA